MVILIEKCVTRFEDLGPNLTMKDFVSSHKILWIYNELFR